MRFDYMNILRVWRDRLLYIAGCVLHGITRSNTRCITTRAAMYGRKAAHRNSTELTPPRSDFSHSCAAWRVGATRCGWFTAGCPDFSRHSPGPRRQMSGRVCRGSAAGRSPRRGDRSAPPRLSASSPTCTEKSRPLTSAGAREIVQLCLSHKKSDEVKFKVRSA